MEEVSRIVPPTVVVADPAVRSGYLVRPLPTMVPFRQREPPRQVVELVAVDELSLLSVRT